METENVGSQGGKAKRQGKSKGKGKGGKKKRRKAGEVGLSIYRGAKDTVGVVSANVGGWKGASALVGAGAAAVGAWYFGSKLVENNYLRGLLLVGLSAPMFLLRNRTAASAGAAISAVGLITGTLTFFRNTWPEEAAEPAEA